MTRKPTQRIGNGYLKGRMKMLTIETVSNGWIVRNKWTESDLSESEVKVLVLDTVEDEGGQITGQIRLLQEVAEMLGLYGSRHDEWRIHITKRHGDKWEKNV